MITAEQCFLDSLSAPVRKIRARVEMYTYNNILARTFKDTDILVNFTVDRVGESNKFFGFGICQRLNVKLMDKQRRIGTPANNYLDVSFGADCDFVYPFPKFKITESHRDENTNELSVTAYDALYGASTYTMANLELSAPYTIYDLLRAIAAKLNVSLSLVNLKETDTMLNLFYYMGANFNGNENLRNVLDDIAEATQTIYYINYLGELTFRRLDKSDYGSFFITKDDYYTLKSGTNRKLCGIHHVTELGDNVLVEAALTGTIQEVYNNPFWELRDDIATILNTAMTNAQYITLNQFDCTWRGNYLLEIGDRIQLETKDNQIVYSYLLNDSLEYDGTLKQKTKWQFENDAVKVESNPVTLGDALNSAVARVDKVNRRIDLSIKEVQANTKKISSLEMTADDIKASVSAIETDVDERISEIKIKADGISASVSALETVVNENKTELIESISSLQLSNDGIIASVESVQSSMETANQNTSNSINDLYSKVEAKMSASDVTLQIQKEMANGVDKVTTSTGFTFDEVGLTVAKSGSEMTTTITEDGMTVYRDSEAVLTANNTGVDAKNLSASTYLIIGTNSRFENYGSNRTGCFWIGG